MARTTDEVTIGPSIVTFDGKDIGHTKGGTTISYEPEYVDLTVDQYSASVDKVLASENVTASAILAQIGLDSVSLANPQGATDTDSVGFGTDSGYRASENEGELRFHPQHLPEEDETEDWVFHRAVVTSSWELGQNKEDQTVLEISWQMLVDETKPDKYRLGYYGVHEFS